MIGFFKYLFQSGRADCVDNDVLGVVLNANRDSHGMKRPRCKSD